jgi:hypothetical protein
VVTKSPGSFAASEMLQTPSRRRQAAGMLTSIEAEITAT